MLTTSHSLSAVSDVEDALACMWKRAVKYLIVKSECSVDNAKKQRFACCYLIFVKTGTSHRQ